MSLTVAQKQAIEKYSKDKVEKTTIRLPKGTKARIKATGTNTANRFIVNAVLEKLSSVGK